jgi:hypothetical protein
MRTEILAVNQVVWFAVQETSNDGVVFNSELGARKVEFVRVRDPLELEESGHSGGNLRIRLVGIRRRADDLPFMNL